MKSFARKSITNDFILDADTGVGFVSGASSVGSALDAIVKTVRGELAFDTEKGVPYFTTVFSGVITLPEWEEEMRMAIRSCPQVIELVSFETEVDEDNGILKYEATVDTDEGLATSSGVYGNGKWSVEGAGSSDMVDYVLGERRIYNSDSTNISVKITNGGTSFSIRVRTIAGASMSVNWGDRTITSGISSPDSDLTLTHEYINSGIFYIELSSGARRMAIGSTDSVSDVSKTFVTSIDYLSAEITDLKNAFAGCFNLSGSIPVVSSSVTDMSGCFKGCVGLVGAVPSWGSCVVDVSECYYGCTGLTGIIPRWGSAITDVESCYYGCTGLTGTWTSYKSELMPDGIQSHIDCVTGCDYSIRTLFKTSWGGLLPVLINSDLYGTTIKVINEYTGEITLEESDNGEDLLIEVNDILVESGSSHAQLTDDNTVFDAMDAINSFPFGNL